MKIDKWICIACKALLGHVEDKKIVRVKRRDFCVEIDCVTGTRVTMSCYRCGRRNEVYDENEQIQDITS